MMLDKAKRIKAEAAEILDDKITIVELPDGNARLNIGDFEFNDSTQAYLHIQQIALFELVMNRSYLVS